MDLESIRLILLMIKNTSRNSIDVNKLYRAGFSDVDIGVICNECLDKGFIVKERNNFVITELGIEEIERINGILGKRYIEKSLAEYSKYKIEKISIDSIYIPKDL